MLLNYATNSPERRAAPRYRLALPVELGCAHGLTRDVSASGVLFEATVGEVPREGHGVKFRLSLQSFGRRIRCGGRVVRVQRQGARYIVASTIEDWDIECQQAPGLSN